MLMDWMIWIEKKMLITLFTQEIMQICKQKS